MADIHTLPRGMFFDWDGTLADSYVFLESAHNDVRQKLDIPAMKPDEFKLYFGKPREMLYTHLYGERREEAKSLFETYVQANRSALKPLEAAGDLLAYLHAAGVVMGVVSNKRTDFIRAEIMHFGWDSYFVSSIGAGDAAEDKPSAAPLLLALEQAGPGLNPDNIWYVGDTESDLLCAQNAGCTCVFFDNMPQSAVLAEQYKPSLVYTGCGEFLAHIRTLG